MRPHWPRAAVVAYTVGIWALVWALASACRVADAAPIAWGTPYWVGDSLIVPVQWVPVCDANGCPTAFGTVWAIQEEDAVDRVVRVDTVRTSRDSLVIAPVAVGQSTEICVTVVALRRQVASDPRTDCQRIAQPDLPPPPVDSLRWDSVRVQPPPPPPPPPPPADSGWTIHYDFEGAALGSVPRGFFAGTPPRSGSWVSNAQARTGTQSVRLAIQEGTDGWGSWGGNISFPQRVRRGQTIRVRSSWYIPTGFSPRPPGSGSSLRNKFLRIRTNSDTGKPLHLDLAWNGRAMTNPLPYAWCFEGGGYVDFYRPVGSPVQVNTWETIEWAMVLDHVSMADGGLARVLVWKNGVLVGDLQDVRTLTNSTGYADLLRIFTYWNDKAPKDEHVWLDDLTITTVTPTARDAAGNPYLGLR